MKAENSYTNYNVRYASNPMDAKHYTTDRLRGEFAIEKVFAPGEVNWTYTMFDRFLIGGAEPTAAPLQLTSIAPLYTDKPNDQKNLLDNRELGIINIGGEGTVTVDGKKYVLGFQEALYVGRGAKNIEVSSKDAADPAKFYMNSACAHQTFPTKKVTLKDANNIKAGSLKESNDRVIHQLIIDGVAGVRTCQLQMGVTELKEGSVWNTMPAHTHLRRMETYLYYNVPEEQPYADGGDGNGGITTRLHQSECLNRVVTLNLHRYPTATSVHHCTSAPYEDGDEITFLGTHPIDKLSSEEVGDGIEDGEKSCNRTIMVVRPVELRSDEVFPCQR